MIMEGWIKSYRAILDNPIVCKDADHYAVWGYLLHNAAHTPTDTVFNGKRITLNPGQLITGRKKIADAFKIDESKVRRILKLFETEQQIEQRATNTSTLISILNWSIYQSNDQPSNQQMNNERPTNAQQMTSGCTTDEQRPTNGCTTSDPQVTTIQECKNIKNDNNVENVKNITHTAFSTQRKKISRATEILEWIAATYPEFQQMREPLTEQQAEWLTAKYTDDDIRRIVMAMDNKGATKNKSAFSTFVAFAGNDAILKERKEAAAGKQYTYVEVCDLVGRGGFVMDDFIPVGATTGGKKLFARRQDITPNA